MAVILELTFPSDEAMAAWVASTPPHGFSFDIEPGFIPNEAPPPAAVSLIFPQLAHAPGKLVTLRCGANTWEAAAAIAHATRFGATGRAILTDVPFRWADDYDDPRDSTVHVLLTLRADGSRRDETLSGRQARGYVQSDDLPPLNEMKHRLRRK